MVEEGARIMTQAKIRAFLGHIETIEVEREVSVILECQVISEQKPAHAKKSTQC